MQLIFSVLGSLVWAIGLLLVVFVVCFGILMAVQAIIEEIKRRKELRLRESLVSNLMEIRRWCSYEFPQIGFFADKLCEAIVGGWSLGASQFREEARKLFPAKEETADPVPAAEWEKSFDYKFKALLEMRISQGSIKEIKAFVAEYIKAAETRGRFAGIVEIKQLLNVHLSDVKN
jgi:hypothetical protein